MPSSRSSPRITISLFTASFYSKRPPRTHALPNDTKVILDLRKYVLRAREILQEDFSDVDGSSSASSGDEPCQDSYPGSQNLTKLALNPLTKYIDLLMDPCPTLEQAYRDQHQTSRGTAKQLTEVDVSTASLPYVRNVRDKFPLAKLSLAERLGEANWQRHERLRAIVAEKSGTVPEQEQATSLPAKSPYQPISTFKDSALGSSLPAQSERTPTVASHSSFVSSMEGNDNDNGRFRVPQQPVSSEGERLLCSYCARDISFIGSRVEWKLHVFADLQAYICTASDCSELLRTFPTRKQWFDHEMDHHHTRTLYNCQLCDVTHTDETAFLNHTLKDHNVPIGTPSLKTALVSTASVSVATAAHDLQCSLCLQTRWLKHRDYATHVGKHLENIALCALSPDIDTDTEAEGSVSDGSINGNKENAEDNAGWITAENLQIQAAKGNIEAVVNILNILQKAEPEAAIAASKAGHEEVLQYLLELGDADPDPEPVQELEAGFNTPMLAAIGRGHLDVVKLLSSQKGFNPMRKVNGRTYFEIAADRKGDKWQQEQHILRLAYEKHASSWEFTDIDAGHSKSTEASEEDPAEAKYRDKFPNSYTKQEWDSQRDNFSKYYLTHNMTLPQATRTMAELHDFRATPSQWQRHIRAWGFRKYGPPSAHLQQLRDPLWSSR